MEDNGGKFTIIIVLLSAILLFMIGVWIVPNVNITRTKTFEVTVTTLDAVDITVNWTAKYKAPIIIPREEKERAEGKIKLYGELRLHALVNPSLAIMLYDTNLDELQKRFDNTENAIREIIRMFDKRVDNVKSIKLNTFIFEDAFLKAIEKHKDLERNRQVADSLKNVFISKLI